MPGIFEFMKRMAAGKPIYDPNDVKPDGQYPDQPLDNQPLDGQLPLTPQNMQGQQSQDQTSPIRNRDESTFPVVEVQHVVTRVNGDTMQVQCWLYNHSQVQIKLDCFHLLDRDVRMTDDLRPNQSHEYIVYQGPVLQDRGSDEALLRYCTIDRQYYFEARYDAGFQYDENNKYYTVDELRLHPPIRGIYS